jgi:hypothetical protein
MGRKRFPKSWGAEQTQWSLKSGMGIPHRFIPLRGDGYKKCRKSIFRMELSFQTEGKRHKLF